MSFMQNMKDALKKSAEEGLYFPVAYDASKKQASATLFFMYLANVLALVSIIWLHFQNDPFVATITAAIYSVVWTVLYMMRRLQKAKFDLDDRSIELDSGEEESETKQE